MGKIQISKEQIKQYYLEGKSTVEIAQIANCNQSNINSHLKRMNVSIRKPFEIRKYTLNKDYFKVINTQKKAYILGLLYADGYNQETKNQIRLTLQRQDRNILDKINIELNHNKPLILLRDKYLDLSINSKEISRDLSNLGCTQKKSFTIEFPYTKIPKNLYKDFIRGYFDGDGCISINQYNDIQINITGNLKFIIEIQLIFESILNVNRTKLQKRNSSYSLFYHGKNVCFKILDYLYRDNPISLERKEKLYKKIVSLQ
jgi:intein-encoded DNA endonuclease-like protein